MVLVKHRYSVVQHRRAPRAGAIVGTWLILTGGSGSVPVMTTTTLSSGVKNANNNFRYCLEQPPINETTINTYRHVNA